VTTSSPSTRLRTGRQLTAADLEALERMVGASGIGDEELLRQAAQEAQGPGALHPRARRSRPGAAKDAFADFLENHQLNSNQIRFVNLIIDSLAELGVVEAPPAATRGQEPCPHPGDANTKVPGVAS
jgi:type I restriction enzyme, R subunit